MEPEACLLFRVQPGIIPTRLVEQHKGADHIGGDEGTRRVNRAVDMAFGREVDNAVRTMGLEDVPHRIAIGDVAQHEVIEIGLGTLFQCLRRGGIGHLVEVDHPGVGGAQDMPDQR